MKWASDWDPVEIGGATVHDVIAESAACAGDRPALIDGESGEVVSYATLREQIGRTAAGIAQRGLGPGDVVAVWAPNLPGWASVGVGAMAAGCAVTGVSAQASDGELQAQLRETGAALVVTIPSLAPTARRVASATGGHEVVVIGDAEGATPLTELLASRAPAPRVELDPAAAAALLPYTSGTTAAPRPVVHTHSSIVTSVRQQRCALRPSEADVVLAIAPFSHLIGFVNTLATSLAAGAAVVTMERFEPQSALPLIERHGVTVLLGSPPLMAALAHHPAVDAHDLSTIQLIVSGGAPLGADLQRAVAERIPSAAVGQAWGLTEASAGTIPDRETGTLPGSAGRLAPNTELRVIDPGSGIQLGAGEAGELWLRGPQLMAGYLGRPAATAQLIDSDGWLHTGDLGRVDDDGNLFIVDRLRALIHVREHAVSPVELEALVAKHPAVADVAIVPRPDPDHGEVPIAFVVPHGEVDSDELTAWVAERVAPDQAIRAVHLIEAIPRTPAGKILRPVLLERVRQLA